MKIAILLLCAGLAQAADPQFSPKGELMKPKNYREWVYLSSGLGMTYGNPDTAPDANPNFDNVFVEPTAYRKFLETGHWPDKAMFVLEIRQSVSKGSINNGGHYQNGIIAVEAAVKSAGRFKDGWGYFGFGANGATAKLFGPAAGCNTCHSKNAAVENTFVQFYPTLLEVARAKNTLRPSYITVEAAHKSDIVTSGSASTLSSTTPSAGR